MISPCGTWQYHKTSLEVAKIVPLHSELSLQKWRLHFGACGGDQSGQRMTWEFAATHGTAPTESEE